MTVAEMLRLRAEGVSPSEIARRAGLTKNQVFGRLKRGKELSGKAPIAPAVVERGKSLLRRGLTQAQVRELCGVSIATIARWSAALREESAAERAAAMEAEMRGGVAALGDVAPVVEAARPAPDPFVASLMARGLPLEEAKYQAALYRWRRYQTRRAA